MPIESSDYWSLLTAVRDLVSEITGLEAARVTLRKGPILAALQDKLKQVIVSPSETLAERIYDRNLQAENSEMVEFDVYVLLITENRWDEDILSWRLAMRQAIYEALFKPTVFTSSLSGIFDVEYNPNPGVNFSYIPDTLDGTCQLFTYRCYRARSLL